MAKVGRKSKYTPAKHDKICEIIRMGNYQETAALCVGISTTTYYDWLHKFPQFADAVKRAEAEAEERDIQVIDKAAKTSWQAAAWKRERKDPEKWGRRDKLWLVADKATTPEACERAAIEMRRLGWVCIPPEIQTKKEIEARLAPDQLPPAKEMFHVEQITVT